ncbi:hypothetical protein VDG1235_3110 [Verrucomicrobiia bacterium DG1235]|nr:hypothetical protein VDG1235_3110 [Verrucomicrobiae bacterium DG1235]
MSKGKTALVLVSDSGFSNTLRSITGEVAWLVQNASSRDLLIGDVDFTHSLFAPFADPRFSNFASIHTWDGFEITYPESESTRVLARFDNGSPLLIETRVGEGTLFVWASSWAPQASQWSLSSKFIPFLHRLALFSSGGPSLPSNTSFTSANIAAYQSLISPTIPRTPGLYRVPSSAGESRWIAFHLPPEESRTQALLQDDWDRLGLPEFDEATRSAQIASITAALQRETDNQTEQRQQIWKWLLWLLLALLATESLVAILVNRRRELAAS